MKDKKFDFRKLIFKFLFSLLLCIIVTSLIFLLNDIYKILDILFYINKLDILILISFSLGIYFGRFMKWCIFLTSLNIKIPLKENIKIFLSGLSMGLTPGKLGEVLKAYILKQKYNIDFSITSPTIIAERLTGVIGCFILCLISMIILNKGNIYSYIFTILFITLLIFVIILLNSPKFVNYLFNRIIKIKICSNKMSIIKNFYNGLINLLDKKIFIITIFISVAYWSLECGLFYFILKIFDVNIDMINSVFIISGISILGGLSFMPGSIGALEGGLIGSLIYKGIDFSLASGMTLLHRFFAMWIIIIIGGIILLLNIKNFKLYK